MKRLILIAGTIIFCFIAFHTTVATGKTEAPKKHNQAPESGKNEVNGGRIHVLHSDTVGLAQYSRQLKHDGNKTIGYIKNTGLLSNANSSLRGNQISWPKGPQQVPCIFGGYFYVASEVVTVDGDTIAIVSDHYPVGELSPDSSHRYHLQALPKYFNMDAPGAGGPPLIGGISEDFGIDGIPGSNDFGENDGILQPEEDFNGNGILDLSMKNFISWFALNKRRETWPQYWPAGAYPGDDRMHGEERPGVRSGRWNGAYGAYAIADQESYYVMDDRENDEFAYYPYNDPTPWPHGKQGLGLTVEVRNYQWQKTMLEDAWISVFDITNKGKQLEKCVIGMFIDPDIGINTGNDAEYDSTNNILYVWNQSGRDPNTGFQTGYVGFVVLESPSNSYDSIDNDGDGHTDESLYNQVDDDGDWQPWEDLNSNGVWDTEDVNFNRILDPGEDLNGNGMLDFEPLNDDVGSDGIGPEMQPDYTGPDLNGSEANGLPDWGEPEYDMTDHDESDQIGVTSLYFKEYTCCMGDDQQFWDEHLQPGTFGATPGWSTDVAFTFGSGFVEMPTDSRQRFILALVFAWDLPELYAKKEAVEILYRNNFMYHDSLLTAINANDDNHRITEFTLEQNYPNPFNPSTTINYSIPISSQIELSIYNVAGQKIRTLIDARKPAGEHSVIWNGLDDSSRKVSSGIYFYRLNIDHETVVSRKMVLLR